MVNEKEYQFKVESKNVDGTEVKIEGRIYLFASNRKKAIKKFEKSYPNFRILFLKKSNGDNIDNG